MSLNPYMKELVENAKLSFEDVFELYAALCVEHVREMTNDIIADDGIDEYVKHSSLSAEALTKQAVDWAVEIIPDMVADDLEGTIRPEESLLAYIIRRKVEMHVAETKAFRVKVV